MNRAIEAFEREFAPWALRLPAADVAARRNGQLRVNGWSVLYEFGQDAYGEYLDYYAALRGATDARVNDDWHARIYATGQIVAFPAVLEAYLYARDPSADELERARAPVLASLEPPAEEPAANIGAADTALWEDLKDVVEAEIAAEPEAPPPRVSVPVRRSAETPAEIDNVLDAAFGGGAPAEVKAPRVRAEPAPVEAPKAAPQAPAEARQAAPQAPAEVRQAPVKVPAAPEAPAPAPVDAVADEAPADEAQSDESRSDEEANEETAEEPAMLESPAPRRSAPGYDPFVELRTLEPKSMRHKAPANDDFRPYWQRYPVRAAGIAAGVAAVVLVVIVAMHRSGPAAKPARAAADTTMTAAAPPPAADTAVAAPTPAPQEDSQTVAAPLPDSADTASAPAPPATATPVSSQSEDNSVARPIGPSSVPRIERVDGTGPSPSTSHRLTRPTSP